MNKEDYIKISEALSTQIFFVADRATEIIEKIFKKVNRAGYITYQALYGNTADPDYILVNNSDRVVSLSLCDRQIFVGIQNDSCFEDETLECQLWELNPLDRIEIADYLAQRF